MKAINCIYSVNINPPSIIPSSPFLRGTQIKRSRVSPKFNNALSMKRVSGIKRVCVVSGLLPVDPWAPNVDSQSIASQLFAFSLFPYLGFLYFITKSKSVPKLTLFGFYFLLAFVGATIPAGIYAKVHYGTSLSNVDWLHGSAESLLTLSNLFVVLGLRKALKEPRDAEENTSEPVSGLGKENPSR